MRTLPKEIKPEVDCTDRNMAIVATIKHTVNQLIDHLTDYEAEQDRRYKELDNRIQEIANLQLEMSREDDDGIDWGERDAEHRRRKGAPEQPKRWRAKECENYWYVSDMGYLIDEAEVYNLADNFRYAIGNYHPTREAAEAYKARLLELGKEI